MDLINFLNNNENARKIFGKRELKIIEKQLKGINLTQSEKNRLSRDIRKKFDFIRESYKYENEFDLKKGAEIKKIIQETTDIILATKFKPQIKRIYLFGSTATNKLTFRSDIDIAVEFEKINLKEATKFRIEIASKAKEKVDVQVFNILPEKIKKEVLNNHKILFENGKNRG